MTKKTTFSKHYKYIFNQLNKKGKQKLNHIISFIDSLVTVLEEKGINENEYEKILKEKHT